MYNLVVHGDIESLRNNADLLVAYIKGYWCIMLLSLYDFIRNEIIQSIIDYVKEKQKYDRENIDPLLKFRTKDATEEINRIVKSWGVFLNEFENINFPISTDDFDFTNFWLLKQDTEIGTFDKGKVFRRAITRKDDNPFFTNSPLFFIVANAYRSLHLNFKRKEITLNESFILNDIDMSYKNLKKVLNNIDMNLTVSEAVYKKFVANSIEMIRKFQSFDLYFQENLWHNFFNLMVFIKLYVIYNATADLNLEKGATKDSFLKSFANGTMTLAQFEEYMFSLININLGVKAKLIPDFEDHVLDTAANSCLLEVDDDEFVQLLFVIKE